MCMEDLFLSTILMVKFLSLIWKNVHKRTRHPQYQIQQLEKGINIKKDPK